jgi:RNA polymerase primary sigma factor
MNKKIKKLKKQKEIRTLDKKIVSENMSMITSIAHKYKYYFPYLDFDDLVSEGIYGLYEATKNYNKKRKVKFSTYARFWVEKYIHKYITESFTMLKVPLNVLKNLKSIMNYISKNKEKVSLEEISEKLKFDLDKVKELLVEQLKTKKSLSLDKYLDEEDQEENFYNIISDEKELPIDTVLQSQEKKEYFYSLLSNLTKEESEVLKLRFGLEGNTPHTLKDIAKKFNTTTQKIKDIEFKALLKLKRINKETNFYDEQ